MSVNLSISLFDSFGFLSFFRKTSWEQQADRQHSFHPWTSEVFGGCVSIDIGNSSHSVLRFMMLDVVIEYAMLVTGVLIIIRSPGLSLQTSIILPVSVRCKCVGERHSITSGFIEVINIPYGSFFYVKCVAWWPIFRFLSNNGLNGSLPNLTGMNVLTYL